MVNGEISSNTVFIVDIYNPYSPYNDNVRLIFWLNGRQWAIKQVKLNWGKPIVPALIDDETQPEDFYLYNTLEEAQNFVHMLQRINR